MNLMTRVGLLACVSCVSAFAAAVAPSASPGIREWSITTEPPVRGKSLVTVRMTPSVTADYDALEFDCTLRQEYNRTGSDGVAHKRVVEPAVFTYRETDARMVEDLDKHVSFRVPVGLEDVRNAFGDTLFVDEAPVTISRITIKAMKDGQVMWQVESPPFGTHTPPVKTSVKPAAGRTAR